MGASRFFAGAAGAAVALAAVAALGTAGAAPSSSGHDHAAHEHADHRIPPTELGDLKAATRPFHDLQAALDSGRIDLDLCFDQMGEHYANPATFGDGILDPLAPEALVYAHRGDGLELVAVEWVSTTPGAVHGVDLHLNEALGVYVLHAWIWEHNPDGQLADFNPRIGDCP